LLDAVLGAQAGNSPVLSYQIDYDVGVGVWQELKGYSTNDATLEWIEPNLQISIDYKVRYRARNAYGWSEYSPEGIVRSTMIPEVISEPTVNLLFTSVEVAWIEPNARGDAIEFYIIEILTKAGDFVEHPEYCHRIQLVSCQIPMAVITGPTYGLERGDLIQARVTSVNLKGQAPFSEANVEGALAEVIPETPTALLTKSLAHSTVSKIVVLIEPIEPYSAAAGGSTITSYNLEFNSGAGVIFTEVVGYTTESLLNQVEVATTPGTTYKFRYRVKNIHGFSSDYSPVAEFKSAEAPEMPSNLQTAISGRNVRITWTPNADNYDAITRFEVQIQSIDLQWFDETLTCDGANQIILETNECFIPLTRLLANNFKLVQGSPVVVRIAATNTIGSSPFAVHSGVLIQTIPI
jgi:hypothetical protein